MKIIKQCDRLDQNLESREKITLQNNQYCSVRQLIYFDKKITEVETKDHGLSSRNRQDAIDYINNNLAQTLSIDAIAKYLNLSRYHFSRKFKQSMGLSLYQYIIQQRVLKAKQLLQEAEMSLVDIAFDCGFTHQSHLCNRFKQLTGVTPKQFQKNTNL